MPRTRILIADDHPNMRVGVLRLLEREFEIVGTVPDGRALIEADTQMKPDVCVVDISMPFICGLEAVTELKRNGSTSKFVILTVNEDPDFVQAAIDAGALGYVVKARMGSDLHPAIRSAMAEQFFVSPTCMFDCQSEQETKIES